MYPPLGACTAPKPPAWRKRSAWVLGLCMVMLLAAQWLLISHAPHDGHGHRDGEPVAACAVCMFTAKGQDSAAPLPTAALGVLALPALFMRLPEPADDAWGQSLRTRPPARGPPRARLR